MAKTKAKIETKTITMYAYPSLKQGDGWKVILDSNKGKVVKSLKDWAEQLEESGRCLRAMASVLEDAKGLSGDGMTHGAYIRGIPTDVLASVLKASDGLANEDEIPNEDEEAGK